VRVPVLINRVISFQKQGDYDITIATQRLVKDFRRVEQFEDCDPCAGTNAVRIHVSERDESEEAALVKTLSDALEQSQILEIDRAEARQELERMEERLSQIAASSQKEAEQKRVLEKVGRMTEESQRKYEQKQADRRLAAERLAYLAGEDAVRAKVRSIAENANRSDGDLVAWIMIDGLGASRNKQLQFALVETLWRDPERVPTTVLHDALYDARVLTHSSMVRDVSFGLSQEEREQYWDEYAKDIEVIATTLPSRSNSIREQTVEFLKAPQNEVLLRRLDRSRK
jgi:hypothetical protein